LPVLVVGHDDDLGAGAAGGLPVGQYIAAVLGAASEDLISRPQRDGVKGRVPGVGGVVEQCDLLAAAAGQLGQRRMGGGDRLGRLGGGLVPADLRLPAQLGGHRIERRLRQQRRPSIVQMNAPSTARCLPPKGIDVHGGDATSPHNRGAHLFPCVYPR
jgi:hypothetical protein